MKSASVRSNRTALVFIAIAVLSNLLVPRAATGEWQRDGMPICTARGSQGSTQIAPDGAGGALIVWSDNRKGYGNYDSLDIYGQKVSVNGETQWGLNGVLVCGALGDQVSPVVCKDGAGGAIISWLDIHSGSQYRVYAQRVSAGGNVCWAIGGVALSSGDGDEGSVHIVSDGQGGAIIVWDRYYNYYTGVRAQRVNADGDLLWGPDGIMLASDVDSPPGVVAAEDGSGGVLAAWILSGWDDVIAQRVDGSGNLLWGPEGAPACTGYPPSPNNVVIVSDCAGGAIVAWDDIRAGASAIYAQHINAGGNVLWPEGGALVCGAEYPGSIGQEYPAIASDGVGGAIVTWFDRPSNSAYSLNIYAQRIDGAGALVWPGSRVPVCTASGSQWLPQIVSDKSGGAIITWSDERDESYEGDIYTQRVSAGGEALWTTDGVAISKAIDLQKNPVLIEDGSHGAIIAWDDLRTTDYFDVYASRVAANGTTDVVFAEASAVAGNGHVTLSWQTTAEATARSFRIQRSESFDGEFATLDLQIIMSSALSFHCTDYSVLPGKTYWYKIVLVTGSTEESYGPIAARIEPSPKVFAAHQSFPNPFNPVCTIRYDIPAPVAASLQILDVEGSVVRKLLSDAWREPGVYSEVWDGKADDGNALPSGVYFYQLKAGEFVAARKIVLLR